jgi:membrane-associated phospholipid phosphatase
VSAYAWPLLSLTAVHGGTAGEWGRDQLAVASSLGVAQLAADVAKRTFRRARPMVVFDRQPIVEGDDVHSFISGHSATTFAAVVAAGTIATRRHSPDAAWIWAGGLGLASVTAYLRIAADRHFLTDVLAGAGVGVGIGVLMPHLFDEYGATGTVSAYQTPPIAGVGPVARFSAARVPLSIQAAAGSRTLGIVGAVSVQ